MPLPFGGGGRAESDACVDDQAIQQHEQGRQDKDNTEHTDNGAPGHQIAQGTDDINVRINGYAEGGGKQPQCADDNGWDRCCQCDGHGICFALPVASLQLIPGRHENGVVHGGAQLDRTDTDRCDKRQRGVGVIGQSQVDEDGKFDDRHQNKRQEKLFSLPVQ